MSAIRVNAIVVNYRKWELTGRCLESLAASRDVDMRIFLVDNHSEEAPPEWTAGIHGLALLRLEENTGFAGGNNAGFELSISDPAPYTFFLNNDAEVSPDTARLLVNLLERQGDAGVACPAIYYASEPDRIWAAGGELVPLRMKYVQNRYRCRKDLPTDPVRTGFASGCAMMVRSGLFASSGGFREEYFMYFEDAELCTRLAAEGYAVWLEPRAAVLHHVAAASGGRLSPLPVYFSERNRIALSREVLPPGLRAAFLLYVTAVLLVKTFKFLAWQGPNLVPWIWRGYLDGILRRTGLRKGIRALVT
jgi:GT2 family glycosyltransferase